ncbi:hypothetical protein JXI42_08015 [bacterium]|nr:hypothetical protein [bacterium]
MLKRRGISLLDVIILILIVGVVAALTIPYLRKEKEQNYEETCRLKLKILAEAELNYYISGGQIEDTTVIDTTDGEEDVEEEEEVIHHVYTDDIMKLMPFMPDNIDGIPIKADTIDFKCPQENSMYIFTVKDSLFYSITCPNGHGVVVNGAYSWELK